MSISWQRRRPTFPYGIPYRPMSSYHYLIMSYLIVSYLISDMDECHLCCISCSIDLGWGWGWGGGEIGNY